MIDVFGLVAEESRRRILDELSTRDGMLVGELTEATGLTQSNVSKHLRLLRDGGLVFGTSEGKARRYRVDPGALAPVEQWLAPYRQKWTTSLNALQHHLDENPTEEERP